MSSKRDLYCNLSEAKEFCRRTAAHVAALCDCSATISGNQAKELGDEDLRCAFVLTILALEETGKLFRVWQAAALAEEQTQNRIVVGDLFADHQTKGAVAGDLCCQMLDFVSRTPPATSPPYGQLNVAMHEAVEDAKAHLKKIYQGFESVREIAMYTANDSGDAWRAITKRVRDNIVVENFLLWLVARSAATYLETGGGFLTATKALIDIQKGVQSNEAFEFAGRMMVGMGSYDHR